MIKFIAGIITFCLLVGIGDTFFRMTYKMATGAKDAFQNDQIKFSAFTHELTKPASKNKK